MTIEEISQRIFRRIHNRDADMEQPTDQLRIYDLMLILLALKGAKLMIVDAAEGEEKDGK